MSEGKIAAVLVGFFIVATTAGTWAAYSYAVPSAALLAAKLEAQLEQPAGRVPQMSNANAKSDRLAVSAEPVAVNAEAEATPAPASYTVAAFASNPADLPKPRTEPRMDFRKTATPAPAEKPKRAEPKLLLDDMQISSLKTRLKLSEMQEEYWPAVEVTLRNVVRAHARKLRRTETHGPVPQIDVNSPEVQQLITAAVPLIMRLSEEQKREVRQLARIIGLETVASRI